MKKAQVKLADSVQVTHDEMVQQHRKVQQEINNLPEDKKAAVKAVQKLVDHEINEMNALFFNDGMFAVDKFLARNGLSGTDKEALMDAISSAQKGHIFTFKGKPFIKSHDGLVHSVRDYITCLEMTIAEQVQFKEVRYVSYDSELDKLGVLDLIKLAFKKLFKTEKN